LHPITRKPRMLGTPLRSRLLAPQKI